jgi:hypothetical protein
MQRRFDEFWDEIKQYRQRQRSEPESEKTIREPAVDRELHYTAHGKPNQEQSCGGVEPGEPEQRGEDVPLRRIQFRVATGFESQQRASGDDGIRREQDRGASAREFEPFKTSGVSGKNGNDANRHAEIPKQRTDGDR